MNQNMPYFFGTELGLKQNQAIIFLGRLCWDHKPQVSNWGGYGSMFRAVNALGLPAILLSSVIPNNPESNSRLSIKVFPFEQPVIYLFLPRK